jgi:Carbohydrate binding module (family 6)
MNDLAGSIIDSYPVTLSTRRNKGSVAFGIFYGFTSIGQLSFFQSPVDGGGQDVGYIDNGDWMDYNVNVPQAGTYSVYFRVASPTYNAQFVIKDTTGNVLSTVYVPQTGGFQKRQTVPLPWI